MATKKQQEQYGNSSISMLKGEDRVRKRPAVIFGSDDLEGCKHAVFEILSNAIDEAREGHGDTIIVTRYEDLSVEVEDFGRGCPVDYNEKEKREEYLFIKPFLIHGLVIVAGINNVVIVIVVRIEKTLFFPLVLRI